MLYKVDMFKTKSNLLVSNLFHQIRNECILKDNRNCKSESQQQLVVSKETKTTKISSKAKFSNPQHSLPVLDLRHFGRQKLSILLRTSTHLHPREKISQFFKDSFFSKITFHFSRKIYIHI